MPDAQAIALKQLQAAQTALDRITLVVSRNRPASLQLNAARLRLKLAAQVLEARKGAG